MPVWTTEEKKKLETRVSFYFFVYWPPFHVFSTLIWIWWNALLGFTHCCLADRHHLALPRPPLPATTHIHAHKHTLLFMDDQKIRTNHSAQHANAHVATKVLGRAKGDAGGTVCGGGGGGWGCETIPSLLNKHISDRPDWPVPISVCFSNHSESLIRHECSATYQNASQVWVCVPGPTLPRQNQTGSSWAPWMYIIQKQNTSPKFKKKYKNRLVRTIK